MNRSRAPWLVLAIGNPSRGDDALGPLLLDRLRGTDLAPAGEVELLTDFQLQVEHALDLEHRHGVLFVDATHAATEDGCALTRIAADERPAATSHALRPQALLRVAQQVTDGVPPAWLLAIEGRSFDLGAGLSRAAVRHLDRAVGLVHAWLRARREDPARELLHA